MMFFLQRVQFIVAIRFLLLIATFLAPCTAVTAGQSGIHERWANLVGRPDDEHLDKLFSPRWIADSSLFWYRRKDAPGLYSFVVVDAKRGVRRPAFDHEGLAKALRARGAEISSKTFPFSWIDVSKRGEYVRFAVDGKKWQFSGNGSLVEYEGKIDEGVLPPLSEEKPSEVGGTASAIVFINRSKQPFTLSWIGRDGLSKDYVTVPAGRSERRETYAGHVWRVSNETSNKVIASFAASEHESTAVIEEDMLSATQPLTEVFPVEAVDKRNHTNSSSKTSALSQVFVRNNNVWVRDDNGAETQISTTGTSANPFDSQVYPSPDGRYAVVYQYTPDQIHTIYMVESSPKNQTQPLLRQLQYLKPGDKVRVDRPRLFDVTAKKEIVTDDTLFRNPFDVSDLSWSPDSSEYRFIFNQRGHQVLRIVGMNTTGKVRSVVEENSNTFVDYSSKQYYRELRNTNELIWASERDGWNHLYLFDMRTGLLKNQITKGDWVVRSVDKIDEVKKQIWLKAFGIIKGQDPYYAQLVRVNFDGTGLTILTDGDGTHSWTWSADGKYFTDTWSRVDQAPQSVVRDAQTGNATMTVEKRESDTFLAVLPIERFAATGRDNSTMVYGMIIKPTTFNESAKYPILEYIYAGPQDFFVPKAYSSQVSLRSIADLGFIVVQVDGMGTNWRSKAFHDTCFKNLKDAGLPDRRAWMTAAARSRPWMDLSRIGVFGSSAGGQNAMSAMLWHGDFYKAAFSDSGCHDNRMDKIWWNEQWMGWPVDKAYEDSSNVVNAGKLRGSLMLTVGELDTNVDPASTMQVVGALTNAGKDYELLFFPGGGHGVGSSSQYGSRKLREFFTTHLQGKSPRGNAI